MRSFLRKLFGRKRVALAASVVQGWDGVPDGNHATVRAVISRDDRSANDIVLLRRIQYALVALLHEVVAPHTRAEKELKDFMREPATGRPAHQSIPKSLSEGALAEFAEFLMPYRHIPSDVNVFDINQGMLPCLAEPEEGGAIEVQRLTWDLIEERQEQRIDHLRQREGVVVHAVRAQANHALFEPGPTDLPALVLFTFDREVERDRDYLHELATRLFDLKSREANNADEARAQEIILANERMALYHRRARLPRGFTGGPDVYAADFWFHRSYLPGGHLVSQRDRVVRCIAEPGDTGGIEHMPARKD
jgi:hypothetical protein